MLSLLAGLCLLTADPVKKSPLVGYWSGTLTLGVAKLRVGFAVAETDGKLTAKLDSPDQGVKGLPCDPPTLADGTTTVSGKAIGFAFKGKLSEDGQTLTGNWEQGSVKLPLTLTRSDKPPAVKRPQTPKPPFPYAIKDVTFENAAAKVKLAGTLTTPAGDGPFPAVVLVSGSGPQDRDETLFDHKPFLVLADYLSRRGIAVLRYDDRGVGQSTGTHGTATTADFATDAWAAVEFLTKQPKIDRQRVGVMGHSEGGLVAPMVAADHPDAVAYIVLLAGPGVPGAAIVDRQRVDILKAAGTPAGTIDLFVKLYAKLNPIATGPGSVEERKTALTKAVADYRETLTEEQRRLVGQTKPDAAAAIAAVMTSPWMDAFLRFDPAPTLKRVSCPVLALTGSLDLQVAADVNLPAIGAALKAGKNPPAEFVEMKGLNHLFQPAKTGGVGEYGQIETTFDEAAMAHIAEWILKTGPR
jgi:pimeloyl-ACP methyl ester carboxylesterase